MSEHPDESELALYADGEAPSSVDKHVAHCQSCRATALSYAALRRSLATVQADVTQRDLDGVRSAVMGRLPQKHRLPALWTWLPLPAALAALALMFWPVQRSPSTNARRPLPVLPTPILGTRQLAVIRQPLSMRRRIQRPPHVPKAAAGLRSVSLLSPAGQAPVIRLTTADPSVIILLQTDERTAANE